MKVSPLGWFLGLLAVASLAVLTPQLQAPHRTADFGAALVAVAVAVAVHVALSMWVVLSLGLLAIAQRCRAARGLADRVAPVVLRGALVTGVAGALAMPMSAHASTTPDSGAAGEPSVHGLQLPDRPSGSLGTEPSGPGQVPVTVESGDSLWSIVAKTLPDSASASDVANGCNRWHEANRDVIGTDPDLLFPAMVLHAPESKETE